MCVCSGKQVPSGFGESPSFTHRSPTSRAWTMRQCFVRISRRPVELRVVSSWHVRNWRILDLIKEPGKNNTNSPKPSKTPDPFCCNMVSLIIPSNPSNVIITGTYPVSKQESKLLGPIDFVGSAGADNPKNQLSPKTGDLERKKRITEPNHAVHSLICSSWFGWCQLT